MNPTCGYTGHVCAVHSRAVQFISRYRDETDYCVGGHRICVLDTGEVRTVDATPEQLERIALFELEEYADYLRWHAEQWHGSAEVPLQAFDKAERVLRYLRK